MRFINYTDIVFRSYQFTDKKQEAVTRKYEIIKSVLDHYRLQPQSFLFVGFNPAIFAGIGKDITVTQVSDTCLEAIKQINPNIKHVPWDHLIVDRDRFDVVVAIDEFLTFAESEEAQKRTLEQICQLSKVIAITTLRDYKNQGFKDREFSLPSVIKTHDSTRIFVEYHDYDMQDRNAWIRSVYEIEGDNVRANRGFCCRQMFFKQCAKFSIDAGAQEFLVHKNLMYKSLIKKNYEHVISIKFRQDGHNKSS
jgi:hypothetical protein